MMIKLLKNLVHFFNGSVQVIRENINLNQEFFFKQVEVDEILIAIRMELLRISHLIV